MIAKTRQVMIDLGLVLTREESGVCMAGELVVLHQDFCLRDADSEEVWRFSVDMPCPARKGMPEDKAVMAAMTSSLNYAIRDVMMVSRGREDQIEAIEDHEDAAKPAPRLPSRGDAVVEKAKRLFAPADVVLDTRESASEEDLVRLHKILESGIAGDGALDRWLRGAEAFVKARGVERTYDKLADIPSAVAAKIIARYAAEYVQWAKEAN